VIADAETLAYRRLAGAILEQAIQDARSSCPKMAAEARHWLISSPWAGDLMDALGVDRGAVADWVSNMEPVVAHWPARSDTDSGEEPDDKEKTNLHP
jgi:hypothetical protein